MFNGPTIKSKDNPRLKLVRRVRDGKETEQILIEGTRLCEEALGSKLSVRGCFVSETFQRSSTFSLLEPKLISRNVESFSVADALIDSISDTKTPQGIVLIGNRPKAVALSDLFSGGDTDRPLPVWIYLYEINNPSNLGAVIRTAEAAGAKGIIVSPNSADPFSPKSLRASMGSAFRLPVVNSAPLEDVFPIASEKGIVVAAVDARGIDSYAGVDWKIPRVLAFGSEAEGLPGGILSRANETIKIPMHGNVESLNLAVSSGIILFEAKRQIEARG